MNQECRRPLVPFESRMKTVINEERTRPLHFLYIPVQCSECGGDIIVLALAYVQDCHSCRMHKKSTKWSDKHKTAVEESTCTSINTKNKFQFIFTTFMKGFRSVHLLRQKPDKFVFFLQEIVQNVSNPTACILIGRSHLRPSVLFFPHVNIVTYLPAAMRLAVYSAYCSSKNQFTLHYAASS